MHAHENAIVKTSMHDKTRKKLIISISIVEYAYKKRLILLTYENVHNFFFHIQAFQHISHCC